MDTRKKKPILRLHPRIRRNFSFLYHVLRAADRHDHLGMAAEIAFVMMFAFFQALLLTVSLLSMLGTQPEVFNSIVYFFGSFLPFELYHLIRKQITEIARAETGGIFLFSLLGTMWTMNTLMYTIKKNLDRSYHAKETRPFWKVRFIVVYIATLATLGIALVLVLLLFGLQIAQVIELRFGHASDIAQLIRIFRLPLAFAVTTMLSGLLYWTMVNVQEHFLEVLPGALFFTTLWFLSTFGFGQYIKNFPYYNTTYGTLGVFVILMIWMYLTALSMLIGGEVNAEIYRRKISARAR